jgi:hypothetical protein
MKFLSFTLIVALSMLSTGASDGVRSLEFLAFSFARSDSKSSSYLPRD